jgi:hypothetical protein
MGMLSAVPLATDSIFSAQRGLSRFSTIARGFIVGKLFDLFRRYFSKSDHSSSHGPA